MAAGGLVDRAKVHVAMTLVELGYSGYFVLTKVSLTGGIDPFVFSTYRDGIGFFALFFLAWLFERDQWPKMSLEVAGLILSMAVLGIYLQQALFLFGLHYTNLIFASTMMNCIPVWTFLIAAFFRTEEVHYKRRDGQAKVLGILSCVFGATVLTLCKGPAILGDLMPEAPLLPTPLAIDALFTTLRGWGIDYWKLGALCLIANSFLCGAFVNIQVPALKRFPAPFTLMSGAALSGTIMFACTAFLRVGGTSRWVLSPGPDLVAGIYAGVVASGMCLFLQCWSNQRGGPILVAAYTPLQPMFSTILGVIFLGDTLYLGSLVGASLILCALFLVIWGQQESQRLQALSHDFSAQSLSDHFPTTKLSSTLIEPLLI